MALWEQIRREHDAAARFSLTDGVQGRRKVSTEQTWECQGDQLKTP